MKKELFSTSMVAVILALGVGLGSVSEARVGGGRSFGSRGSRGFSAPPTTFRTAPTGSNTRSYSNSAPGGQSQPLPPNNPAPSFGGPSLLKSVGAGIAGGMLGSAISRSLGWGGTGYGSPGVGNGGGGFGFLEILLLGGLLFWLYRTFSQRTQPIPIRRPEEFRTEASHPPFNSEPHFMNQAQLEPVSTPLNTEMAMDLFFQIQGAWGNRDLSQIDHLLGSEAKNFLNDEIARLRAAHQINRLENIAVRNVDVLESWREQDREFCTLRFVANLLDFTIDEQTQQIMAGSRTSPVKFEENWTFVKDSFGSQWKLSGIQQN